LDGLLCELNKKNLKPTNMPVSKNKESTLVFYILFWGLAFFDLNSWHNQIKLSSVNILYFSEKQILDKNSEKKLLSAGV